MNTTLTKPKRLTNKNTFLLLLPPPRMLRRASFILLLFFLSTVFSCKEDPPVIPPPPQPKLTLAVDDVSCTEAWLNLKLENITLPVDLELKKDSTIIKTFIAINTTDTTLYVDSLLPNQTYNLQLTSIQNPVSSNELSVITLDTTSHNFTWQTFEFGQHSSSVLYDVAIIDENNIWAVGEIYMNDSLGNSEPNAYNAVHWDGNQWEVKRIEYYGNCSAIEYPPLKAIWAFSKTNIVVTNGGSIGWFNGATIILDCSVNPLLTGAINKIWGSSSSDLYVAGNNGNIAHYNGSQWQLVNIPNDIGMGTLNVRDIWGVKNEENETEILITAAKFPLTRKFVVGKIINNTVVPIFIGNLTDVNPQHGLWFFNHHKYYLTGSSIHSKNDIESAEEWKLEVPSLYFQECIRGTSYNNIFSAGNFGDIFHFNGQSWKSLKMYSGVNNGVFTSISSTPTITAFCGVSNNKAVITIIK